MERFWNKLVQMMSVTRGCTEPNSGLSWSKIKVTVKVDVIFKCASDIKLIHV